jgi:hypothetical protein
MAMSGGHEVEEINMCYLCKEWVKESMTNQEVINAVGEMLEFENDEEKRLHLFELINKVMDKEEESGNNENTVYLNDLDEDDDGCL